MPYQTLCKAGELFFCLAVVSVLIVEELLDLQDGYCELMLSAINVDGCFKSIFYSNVLQQQLLLNNSTDYK